MASVRRIKMQAVETHVIEAIGYDGEHVSLHVRFRPSGETYVYTLVPRRVFDELMAAESVGAYYNLNIRERFSFSKR